MTARPVVIARVAILQWVREVQHSLRCGATWTRNFGCIIWRIWIAIIIYAIAHNLCRAWIHGRIGVITIGIIGNKSRWRCACRDAIRRISKSLI